MLQKHELTADTISVLKLIRDGIKLDKSIVQTHVDNFISDSDKKTKLEELFI